MSLFTLLYYIYIVTDFFTQMKFFVDPADLSPDYESRHSADPDEGKYYTVSKQKLQGICLNPNPHKPFCRLILKRPFNFYSSNLLT